MKWITASQLENWAQSETARAKLPALIATLARASAKHIGTIRFPAEDKSQVHGFDGHLVAAGVPSFRTGNRSGNSAPPRTTLLKPTKTSGPAPNRLHLTSEPLSVSYS